MIKLNLIRFNIQKSGKYIGNPMAFILMVFMRNKEIVTCGLLECMETKGAKTGVIKLRSQALQLVTFSLLVPPLSSSSFAIILHCCVVQLQIRAKNAISHFYMVFSLNSNLSNEFPIQPRMAACCCYHAAAAWQMVRRKGGSTTTSSSHVRVW